MPKVINHLKENYPIYLIILVVVVFIVIIKIVPKDSEQLLDTSMFEVVDIKGALNLFESSHEKASVLVIGRKDCSACINFEPVLKISQAKYHYYTHYLELSDLNKDSEEYQELIDKLDYEYEFNGNKNEFGQFMGATPMFIILKNGKQVYGYIGTMSENVIKTMVTNYNANYE